MKHIIYVDVYFILNFILHLFFLMTTAFFRQKYYRIFRMVLASFFTAMLAVLLPFLFFRHPLIEKMFIIPEQFVLLRLGFHFEGKKIFFKDFFVLLFVALFSGGCITAFLQVFCGIVKKNSILWILIGLLLLLCAFFLLRMELLSSMNMKWKKDIYHVRFSVKRESFEANALYDTGNHLVSPYTGEEVIIISKTLADHFHPKEEKIQLIPYRSLGGKGIMKAFRIDAMEILEKSEKRENVLVAVSDSLGESSDFQVII